jgi:hypothetical protein
MRCLDIVTKRYNLFSEVFQCLRIAFSLVYSASENGHRGINTLGDSASGNGHAGKSLGAYEPTDRG